MLKHVQSDKELYPTVSKELYDKCRAAYQNNNIRGEFEDWQIGCVGFLGSYNGRWFDGGFARPGYEKTSRGLRQRDYYQEAKRNIEKQSKTNGFKNIIFDTADYQDLDFDSCQEKYLIYADPPYANVKQFHNAKDFNYSNFWGTMRKWSKKHIVVVSEMVAPHDFECIWQKTISRSVNASNKTYAIEKLFMYKGNKR